MARTAKSGNTARPLFAAREKLPRRDALRLLALMAATFALMMVIMAISVTPERLKLNAGDIAPRTITATKDVIDEITTNTRMRDAEKNAQVSYTDDSEAETRSIAAVSDAFSRMETVRAQGEQAISLLAASLGEGATPTDEQISAALDEAGLAESARTLLGDVSLTDAQLRALQLMSAD